MKQPWLEWAGTDRLTEHLEAAAGGLWWREAAINLLGQHHYWLSRRDFLTAVVILGDDGWPAGVNWTAAVDFSQTAMASTSELAILRAACSIAGRMPEKFVDEWEPQRWSIAQMTQSLGRRNRQLLLDAIRHAVSGPNA